MSTRPALDPVRLDRALAAGAVLSLVLGAHTVRAQEADADPRVAPPNLVLIVADDLGWNDVGYHGSRIATPHIDRLAEQGVKLEQFYAQSKCSPSRAALMTGRYPIRTGLQHGVIRPWSDIGLPLDELLVSNVLKRAGYETAILGKWHLGLSEPAYLPTQRGFDHQYGHYTGAIHYTRHARLGGRDWNRDDQPVVERGYATDLIALEAVRLIEERAPEKPLFLYVPFNAPHTPLRVPNHLADVETSFEDKDRGTYALMVMCMDEAIGSIVAALEAQGLRDDTLILFLSDNGPDVEGERDEHSAPLRGGKGSFYEGGVRVPALANWPGTLPAGAVVNEVLHVVDVLPTFARLAGASTEGTQPLDGKDAWDTILGRAPTPHADLLLGLGRRMAAVRAGSWKLVRDDSTETLELFDLASDPNELADLSAREPERRAALEALLARYEAQAVEALNASDSPPDDFEAPRNWGHARKRGGKAQSKGERGEH